MQICQTHRAFKLLLCTFSGKLQTFPTVISCSSTQLNPTVHSMQFSSGKLSTSYFQKSAAYKLAYSKVAGTFPLHGNTWHDSTMCVLKTARSAWQTTSSVADVRTKSHFSRKDKDKTEHYSTGKNWSLGTKCIITFQGPTLFT